MSDRRPRREPRHVAEGLNRLLSTLGGPSADVLHVVFDQWDDIVGAELAEHTRPLRLVNRRLVVHVDDPAWAARVRWSQEALLAALAARLGEGRVQQIHPRTAGRISRDRPGSR